MEISSEKNYFYESFSISNQIKLPDNKKFG